jgi:hypothetical protein
MQIIVQLEGQAPYGVDSLDAAYAVFGIDRPEELKFDEYNNDLSMVEFHGIGRIMLKK